MNARITQHDLEILVSRINKLTGNADAPYTHNGNGFHSNVGNYHLDYAYGGVKLVQMVNESGGITNVSTNGYGTKNDQSMPFIPSVAAIERVQKMHDTDTVCRKCGASENFDGAMFTTFGGSNICDDCA